MPLGSSPLGAVLLAHLCLASLGAAQGAGAAPPERYCFGFAFGAWSPPLDARRAGHGPLASGAGATVTPEGRHWAVTGSGASLVLFPSWWPAGVAVRFPGGAPTPGDTVRGEAHAFVADGRAEVPTAPARAWVVPCARPGVPRAPDPARPSPPPSAAAPVHAPRRLLFTPADDRRP
ncbi:MAG TPA: hypothetical protein VFY16_03925 [Gemmatimonadaceae bacterium]|nr:hypothetical protein [Gemmatimonadaceae bacterium]